VTALYEIVSAAAAAAANSTAQTSNPKIRALIRCATRPRRN